MKTKREPATKGEVRAGIGWMLLLVVLAIPAGGFGAGLAMTRERAAVAASGAQLWWPQDGLWLALFTGVVIVGALTIPGAYGASHKQLMPRLGKPSRRLWTAAVFAAFAAVCGLGYQNLGRDLGMATPTQAAWLHDGRIAAASPWSRATGVEVACEMKKRYIVFGRERAELTYEVAFADGRKAPLARAFGRDPAAWPDRVAPIDAALRAARVPRSGVAERDCLMAKAPLIGPGGGVRAFADLYYDRVPQAAPTAAP